jgi:hypothetical protein
VWFLLAPQQFPPKKARKLKSKKPWVPPSPFTPMIGYDEMKTPDLKVIWCGSFVLWNISSTIINMFHKVLLGESYWFKHFFYYCHDTCSWQIFPSHSAILNILNYNYLWIIIIFLHWHQWHSNILFWTETVSEDWSEAIAKEKDDCCSERYLP